MRTIRCLEDLRCLRKSGLDPTLLDALEEDFRKQMDALRFEETEEEFDLAGDGFLVLLERGDNFRDLREVGLSPMRDGLFGMTPEFVERHEIGGKPYYWIVIYFNEDYAMTFILA